MCSILFDIVGAVPSNAASEFADANLDPQRQPFDDRDHAPGCEGLQAGPRTQVRPLGMLTSASELPSLPMIPRRISGWAPGSVSWVELDDLTASLCPSSPFRLLAKFRASSAATVY